MHQIRQNVPGRLGLALRRSVLAVGLGIVAVQWLRTLRDPEGDFHLHWKLARRLVDGEFIYHQGLDFPYPPFWALVHVPATAFPVDIAQAVVFPLFLAAMAGLLWALSRLTNRPLPVTREQAFWAAAISVVFSARFLVRDMVECGVNLALVALSWIAVALWSRNRERLGGACLGLAMALKCTPALFLAWFAWKREWKMVGATVIAAIGFTIAPAFYMGAETFGTTFVAWIENILPGMTEPDPSRGVLGNEQIQNISLRPALARFLMEIPEDRAQSWFEHPLSFHFLDLPPVVAGWVIKALMLALLAGVAWRFRHRIDRRDDPAVLWEGAIVSLLMLLYSPITWGQHCVAVLPFFYLAARSWLAGEKSARPIQAIFTLYAVLVLVANREVLGRESTLLLDSYRVTTWLLLALLGSALALHARALRHAAAAAHDEPATRPQRTAA